MTVICAYKTTAGVHVASDTLCIANGYIKEHCGQKWVQCGRWWIGCAGKIRLQNLIEAQKEGIAALTSIGAIVDAIEGLIKGDNWKAREEPGDPPSYTLELIITDGAEIWSVSGDLSILRLPHDQGWAAVGSGAEAALGALAAFDGYPTLTPAYIIRSAVAIACNIQRNCGGEPFAAFVPKPETTDVQAPPRTGPRN